MRQRLVGPRMLHHDGQVHIPIQNNQYLTQIHLQYFVDPANDSIVPGLCNTCMESARLPAIRPSLLK